MRRILLLLILSALINSCTQIDYFSDYKNVNLISNHDLSSASWALSAQLTDYMTWESAGTTGPDNSQAFRLEIKNLVGNGDFSDATLDTSLWQAVPAPGFSGSPTLLITSNALSFQASNVGDRLLFSIEQALSSLSSVQGTYRLTADIASSFSSDLTFKKTDKSGDSSRVLLLENSVISLAQAQDVLSNNLYDFLEFNGSPDVSGVAFQLGDGRIERPSVQLDNVSLIRDDLALAVQFSLPSIHSGTKPLIPANTAESYRFSVHVQDDTPANNRFSATGLSIIVTAKVELGSTKTYRQFFPRPSSGWTSWTKLELPLGFDFVLNDTSSPVLTIQISPTNIIDTSTAAGGKRCGSLLLASPSFMLVGL